MKKLYTTLLGVAGLTCMLIGVCHAQSGTLALKAPANPIVIDGSSAEWGDSLSYYNPDTKIHYAIANDKTNLYLVVKTKDPIQENNILGGGLTFSVNIKGKKSRSSSTTFPKPSGNVMMAITKPGESVNDKKLRASVTRFKKIGVDGFKDISEDEILASNADDIRVAVSYDNDGSLVFEESIPLALFHAGDLAKGEWAFNIKLNGIESSGGSGSENPASVSGTTTVVTSRSASTGKGGRVSGVDPTTSLMSRPANRGISSPNIDFWGKFTLAQ